MEEGFKTLDMQVRVQIHKQTGYFYYCRLNWLNLHIEFIAIKFFFEYLIISLNSALYIRWHFTN